MLDCLKNLARDKYCMDYEEKKFIAIEKLYRKQVEIAYMPYIYTIVRYFQARLDLTNWIPVGPEPCPEILD